MNKEAKAKVVTSVWGAEFVEFLAALAVLPWSMNLFSQIDQGETSNAARN